MELEHKYVGYGMIRVCNYDYFSAILVTKFVWHPLSCLEVAKYERQD